MESSIPKFSYKPLKTPTSFRVLQFTGRDKGPPLKCTIIERDVSDCSDIFAVSYVWGSRPRKYYTILIDGTELLIPESAYGSLHFIHGALVKADTLGICVWIDCVCINQASIAEKVSQIPLMKDIYSKTAVVANLNLDYQASPENSRMDHFLANMLYRGVEQHFTMEVALKSYFASFGTESKSAFQETFGKALESLANRPYFSRIWNLQEHVLGRHLFVLICNEVVPAEIFFHNLMAAFSQLGLEGFAVPYGFRAMRWLRMKRISSPDAAPEPTYDHVRSDDRDLRLKNSEGSRKTGGIRALVRTLAGRLSHRREHSPGTDKPGSFPRLRSGLAWSKDPRFVDKGTVTSAPAEFSSVLRAACHLHASIEHDKVYGCLAFASNNLRASIKIDYEERLPDLARRIAFNVMKEEQHLGILLAANFISQTGTGSSWALNFQPHSTRPRYQFEELCESSRTAAYDASNGAKQFNPILDDKATLLLEGHLVDEVTVLSEIFPEDLDLNVAEYRRIQERFRVENSSQLSAMSSPIIWRTTFIGGEISNPLFIAKRYTPEDFYAAFVRALHGTLRDGDPPKEMTTMVYYRAMYDKLNGQRLCLAKRFGFGYVPKETQKGDVIAILLGGSFPFVLRKEGSAYRIVGIAYIHNLMQGQGIEKGATPERIRLV